MKKLLLSFIVLIGLNANAQTTIFEDGFEFYNDFDIANVGDWTLTDVDLLPTYGFTGITFANTGVAKSFQVFNAATTTPPIVPSATSDWSAHSGDRHMVCFAAVPTAAAPANNDWLISPQMTLGTANVLTFWAKACDATYFAERYSVWVSTTGTAPANFTKISPGAYTTTPNITWAEKTYNLPVTYNNLPVYIGIKCVSPDMFGFAIDDFKVTGIVLGTESFFASNFAVYPNPADNVLNISTKNSSTLTQIQMTDLNGRIVKSLNAGELSNAQLNIGDLNAGVYFLKVSSAEGVGTTKIIKK